jgi:hypothetical protein
MESSSEKFYYTLFFCLATVLLFSPSFIPPSISYYFSYGMIGLSIFIIIIKYKSTTNTFYLPIVLLLISVIIAAVSAIHSWDQGFFETFKSHSRSLSYLLFFLLIIFKFKIPEIERIIIVLGILYIIVYTASFIAYPRVLFGNPLKYGSERGFQRIATEGQSFLFLFSFFSLDRLLKKPKLVSFIIYFITLVCIIMTLTRTVIAAS